MYVYIHTIHVYMYVYIHTIQCIHVCIDSHYTCIHVCIHSHYTCIHVCIHSHYTMYTCMYTFTLYNVYMYARLFIRDGRIPLQLYFLSMNRNAKPITLSCQHVQRSQKMKIILARYPLIPHRIVYI